MYYNCFIVKELLLPSNYTAVNDMAVQFKYVASYKLKVDIIKK